MKFKIFISLAFACLQSVGMHAQTNPILSGDFNGDGKITVEDVTSLTNIALGKDRPKEIKLDNGQISIIDYDPYNGHEYVDLGLPSGTLWATCNVGATNPEDYGDYFAWGETEPKSSYWLTNYKFYVSDDDNENFGTYNVDKYCNYANWWKGSGEMNCFTELQSEDDVASVKWGKIWSIPTMEQFEELFNNCSFAWTDNYNNAGKAGRVVKSNINNESIFLPAAGGTLWDTDVVSKKNSQGFYWTKTLTGTFQANNWYFTKQSVTQGGSGRMYYSRYEGKSVRPVSQRE